MCVAGRKLRTIFEAFKRVQKRCLLYIQNNSLWSEIRALYNCAHLFHAQTVTLSTKGS